MRAFVIALALLAAAGCKKDKDRAKDPPKEVEPAAVTIDAAPAKPAPAPDAAPAPAAAPDAAPAAKAKTIDLKHIGNGHAFQLDIPEGAEVEETPFSEESFPRGYVRFAGIEIEVMEPESEPGTLEEETSMILRGTGDPKVELAEADPDGYTIVFSQNQHGATTREWSASVNRVPWGVSCGAYGLETRADADTVAAVCRTIRKLEPK